MIGKKIIRELALLSIFAFIAGSLGLSATPKVKPAKADTKKSAAATGGAIFEINGRKYNYDELNTAFKRNYLRLNSELRNLPADSIKNFVDMYAAYRLKITDAEARGLDKDSSVIQELNQNKRIVAESYLVEKELVAPFVNKSLERRKTEMQIAYMIFLANQQDPNDTLAAHNKAMKALNALRKGEDFGEVAKNFSEDSASAVNGGLIDTYITSCRLDRNIEDALYTLKPGEYYNDLVRVPQFGYMLIKAYSIEPRKLVNFKHILINFQEDSLGFDVAKHTIDSLYTLLQIEPSLFESFAGKHSDDNISAKDGGAFKEWYSRSTGFDKIGKNLDGTFEKELFRMADGELSKPIKTQFGYHLIFRNSSKDINEDEEKQEIANIYRRAYLDADKTHLLNEYKTKFGFRIYQENFDRLIAALDTNNTNLDSLWDAKIPLDLMNQDLFAYGNDKVKVKELVHKMKTPGKFRGLPTNPEGINKAINYLTDDRAYADVADDLAKTNDDYRNLVQNFRDGTLLFKVESQEVWNKLQFDSTIARQYYEKNKAKYFTTQSYDLQELFIINKTEMDNLYNRLKNNEISFNDAVSQHTQRSGNRETFGIFSGVKVGKFKIADLAKEHNLKENEFSEPLPVEKGYSVIKVNKIYYPRQQTFEEALPEIAPLVQSEIQKSLSDKWISSLKAKYNFKLNEKELDKLLKK